MRAAGRQADSNQNPNTNSDLRIEEKSTMGKIQGTRHITEKTCEVELEIEVEAPEGNSSPI
jgi:hypothetical protein